MLIASHTPRLARHEAQQGVELGLLVGIGLGRVAGKPAAQAQARASVEPLHLPGQAGARDDGLEAVGEARAEGRRALVGFAA